MLTKWEKLPDYIRVPEVRPYYDLLRKKRFSLLIKRLFDLLAALVLLAFLAIPMLVVAIWVKADSTGPVFYRQERVTKDGKSFRIHKFPWSSVRIKSVARSQSEMTNESPEREKNSVVCAWMSSRNSLTYSPAK